MKRLLFILVIFQIGMVANATDYNRTSYFNYPETYYKSVKSGKSCNFKIKSMDNDYKYKESHIWDISIKKPDLIVTSPKVNPTYVNSGEDITVSSTVKNQGDAKANFGITQTKGLSYYLSKDNSYSADDILLGTTDINNFDAGESRTIDGGKLTIPSDTPSGTYYIIFYVDKPNYIEESNETNNTAYKRITIQIVTLSITPTSRNVDDKAGTITFTINSNVNWTTSCSDSSWLALSPTSGGSGKTTITANYEKNYIAGSGTDQRIDTITFLVNDKKFAVVMITQAGSLVGVHNNKIEKSIHIYPNPAKTKLYVQFKNTSFQNITISVYDLSGKLLYKNHYDNAPFEIIKLNLLNYKKGVYYIHFKTDKGIITKQFIVQ